MTLTYHKTGKFTPENLNVTFLLNGKQVVWKPGMEDSLNLLGTSRTLDKLLGDEIVEPIEPGVLSRSGWALVDDSKRHLLVPDESVWKEWVSVRPEGDRQDWYLFAYGHDYKQALADYALLAGKAPLPPKYTFGYWWSRYWQYSDNEFRNLVEQIKSLDIPIDVYTVPYAVKTIRRLWQQKQQELAKGGDGSAS